MKTAKSTGADDPTVSAASGGSGDRIVNRRTFLWGLTLGTLAAPPVTEAQPSARMPRIGFLGLVSASSHAARLEAFRAGLRDLGYVEGKNIAIEYRWAEGRYERLPQLADELIGLKVDVLVTHASAGARAAKHATTSVPIVVTAAADMVSLGLVASLARPGGNLTGSSFFIAELAGKRLELLKEAIPHLGKAAVLLNPDNPSNRLVLQELEPTAKGLNLTLQRFDARGPSNYQRVLGAMVTQKIGAVVIHEDTVLNATAEAIASAAVKRRLPSCGFPEFARVGGMMAYGVNLPELERRAATFVDKILKGAKPADLPIERATKFTAIINLKTAKALGLTIPQSILLRADQIIE